MTLQSRGVRKLFVSTLVLTAALSACDQPTEVEAPIDPAFAPTPPAAVNTVSCGATTIGGSNKNVQVAVKFSNGSAAGAGVVVTLISKQDGPQCYGETSADGIVKFTGIAKDKQIFVVARDEVSLEVAQLEIVPPAIGSDLTIFDDEASLGAPNRQIPMMLSGTACTTSSDWTWTNWSAQNGSPCVVPGSGFNLILTLGGNAATTNLTLVDPTGAPLIDVIVAALSPWDFKALNANQATACDLAPWIDPLVCDDPDLSSGPAVIESVDLTNASGVVSLGHAAAVPLVFEAITVKDDLTYFATIDPSLGGPTTVQMAPGMCTIASVTDDLDSSIPDVDIKFTQHSVGMSWSADAVPTPINHSLIVRAEVWANVAGGAGRYDLSWLVTGTPSRSVRADFVIPANGAAACGPMSWSGNGLSGVSVTGFCAKSDVQAGVASGRTAYTLYFIVSNVPTPLENAWYGLSTVGDGVDPSKSSNTRAGISFNDDPTTTEIDESTLNRTECPVRQNNDGRFGTFRLGNNDGRFGTF